MQIYIKTKEGGITIDVEMQTTVAEIKQKIKTKTGTPIEQQRIILAAKECKDEFTVEYCGFDKETPSLILRKPSAAPQAMFSTKSTDIPMKTFNASSSNQPKKPGEK